MSGQNREWYKGVPLHTLVEIRNDLITLTIMASKLRAFYLLPRDWLLKLDQVTTQIAGQVKPFEMTNIIKQGKKLESELMLRPTRAFKKDDALKLKLKLSKLIQ